MAKSRVSIRDVYEQVGSLRDEIKEGYVSKSEFLPVKMIAYGVIGTAAAAVLAALFKGLVLATF